MNEKPSGLSELELEAYVAGDLAPPEAEKIRKLAAADAALAARIERIRASDGEILSAYPAEEMARHIEEKAGFARTRALSPSKLLWALPVAAALAIGIGFALIASGRLPVGDSGDEGMRVKGGSLHLSLFRKTNQGADRLADATVAFASDVIQIGYYSAVKGYGAIFSIDGRGLLTFHLPEGYAGADRAAPQIAGTGEAILPTAYELDDAPGFERFFFVFSSKPFPLAELERSARALAATPLEAETGEPRLPAGSSLASFTVKKGVHK